MGQESSTPVDEHTPPQTLQSRTLEGLAKYIRDGRAKRIVVMTGAGISTAAGIPDFRSPKTGLYANLARLNLPYAEAVFDISYFRNNPLPFYTLAHELYPGRYRPTITHSFIALLHRKGLLLKLFTQNIDCLEREAGVPDDKIVEAHGSFAKQSCVECKMPYPDDSMREKIKKMEVPRCIRPSCGGLVKPDIVFFGEQLPVEFFKNRSLPAQADLCIILGTSLTVQPFASLPSIVREEVPRALINLERVGNIGSRPDDVLVLGDCDEGVRKLAAACGWLEELEALWAESAPKVEEEQAEKPQRNKDEEVEDEVEKLTREVEKTLKLSRQNQERWTEEDTERKGEVRVTKAAEEGGGEAGGQVNGKSGKTAESLSFADEVGDVQQAKTQRDKSSESVLEGKTNGASNGPKNLSYIYPHLDEKPSL